MQTEQSIFKLHSEYQSTGDQPQAIEALVKSFKEREVSIYEISKWNRH